MLLTSTILGIRYAIEPMKIAGGGSIINNSSIAGLRYRQGNGLYSALKAAVTHYTRLAGVELGPHGIRVNALSPGWTKTEMTEHGYGWDKFRELQLLGRQFEDGVNLTIWCLPQFFFLIRMRSITLAKI